MTFKRSGLWLLLFAYAFVWFALLGYRPLMHPDEGRYAEIPREMVASGDFVTPRLDDLKYFEKPPLQYWATAIAFKVAGENQWAARFWPGLTGFLTVLLTFFTARRLYGERVGLYAAAILASTVFLGAMGRMITLDMGFAFFLQLSLTGLLFANLPDAGAAARRRWMLVVWAGLALAVLSKGIVALVLGGGVLVGYSVITRDLSLWRRFEWVRGGLLFLAITAPWFILVSLRNHEFAYFFFLHEHFARFLSKVHGRYQPDWYFLALLPPLLLPWTTLVLQGWWRAWRREGAGFQPHWLLGLWALLVIGFFSLSQSKLTAYILPMVPALAILAGRYAEQCSAQALRRHLYATLFMPLVIVVAYAIRDRFTDPPTAALMESFLHAALLAAAMVLAGLVCAQWLFREKAAAQPGQRTKALLVAAIGGFLGVTVLIQGHEPFSRLSSGRDAVAVVKPLLRDGVPIYSVAMYDQSLPFYLKRTMTLVEYRGELDLGLTQEPEKWVPTLDAFIERWNRDSDAFAVMSPEVFQSLQAGGFPMQEVVRDARRVFVRKPQVGQP
ncbi:MAG: glycosyltransferase family 39 protein [Rhodocyclaceae bacterium]|nr:glycosyltransferase family 39 protein [Rhodocyclaceae bacterium]